MNSAYRDNVNAFILAAEGLLSPILSGGPLSKDECRVVQFYLETLTHHCQRLGHNGMTCDESSDEEVLGHPT